MSKATANLANETYRRHPWLWVDLRKFAKHEDLSVFQRKTQIKLKKIKRDGKMISKTGEPSRDYIKTKMALVLIREKDQLQRVSKKRNGPAAMDRERLKQFDIDKRVILTKKQKKDACRQSTNILLGRVMAKPNVRNLLSVANKCGKK